MGRGLYLTLVRRVEEGEPLSIVPLAVAALGARGAGRRKRGAAIALKWPNDLYVGRQKLGGVIAESRTQGGDTHVAIGVGINVQGASSALGVAGATTLEQETGRDAPCSAPCSRLCSTAFDRDSRRPAGTRSARVGAVAPHRAGRLRSRSGSKRRTTVDGHFRGARPRRASCACDRTRVETTSPRGGRRMVSVRGGEPCSPSTSATRTPSRALARERSSCGTGG